MEKDFYKNWIDLRYIIYKLIKVSSESKQTEIVNSFNEILSIMSNIEKINLKGDDIENYEWLRQKVE